MKESIAIKAEITLKLILSSKFKQGDYHMKNANNKLDKLTGSIKEGAGQMLGSEQLELEGKLQKKRGELSEAASELGESLKEKAAEKANKFIDKHKN